MFVTVFMLGGIIQDLFHSEDWDLSLKKAQELIEYYDIDLDPEETRIAPNLRAYWGDSSQDYEVLVLLSEPVVLEESK
jgi:hypothetical protein